MHIGCIKLLFLKYPLGTGYKSQGTPTIAHPKVVILTDRYVYNLAQSCFGLLSYYDNMPTMLGTRHVHQNFEITITRSPGSVHTKLQ